MYGKTDNIKSVLIKKIDKFKEVNPSFKNWVSSLDDNPELINNLDNLGNDLEKIAKDFNFSNLKNSTKFISEPNLVKAWHVLRKHSNIRKVEGNIEVLSKISHRFEYGDKENFEALEILFNEGTNVRSIQSFIDDLDTVNNIFPSAT